MERNEPLSVFRISDSHREIDLIEQAGASSTVVLPLQRSERSNIPILGMVSLLCFAPFVITHGRARGKTQERSTQDRCVHSSDFD
jgi:hypothetical protein